MTNEDFSMTPYNPDAVEDLLRWYERESGIAADTSVLIEIRKGTDLGRRRLEELFDAQDIDAIYEI